MSEHADTAIDQLRLADMVAPASHTSDREVTYYLTAALVHAVLDVGEAIRSASASGWSALDALSQQRQP